MALVNDPDPNQLDEIEVALTPSESEVSNTPEESVTDSSAKAPDSEVETESQVDPSVQTNFMFIDEIVQYYGESDTVEQTDPILVENPKKIPFNDYKETVALPVVPSTVLFKYSDNFPNMKIEESDNGKEWLDNFEKSVFNTPSQDQFVNRIKKPNSKFKQFVDYEGHKLRAGVVKLGANPGDKLTGEQAVYWVKSVTGQGGIIQIPLWHSGFWVSIKTPSEIALLELNARIAEDKVLFGRQTYGLAFSNATVYFTNNLINFVLDHIFDHSVKGVKDIRPLIVSHDIFQLVWGMACAVWKNGFQYTRSVINEDNSVGKTFKALVAVPKISFVDNAALTDWQKSHMSGRHGKNMTLESIEKYRNEFSVGHSRTVTLDEEDDITVELSVPFVDRYIEAGQKWVDFLINKVDSAMKISSDDGRRNEYVVNYGRASLLRQYCHWVKSITVRGRKFEDIDTVESLLDDFSARDSIRNIYFKEIGKFIDDTTVSVIAVPAVKGIDEIDTKSRFPYLVPIDPLMVFFTLLVQKAELVKIR